MKKMGLQKSFEKLQGKGKGKDDWGKPENEVYVYRATVMKVYTDDPASAVYDGDTCHVLIDHGMGTFTQRILRFARINTPELRGGEREEGLKVRDIVREKILGKTVMIECMEDKTGSYARYLAEIILADGTNLNDWLLENGYAKLYKGKKD